MKSHHPVLLLTIKNEETKKSTYISKLYFPSNMAKVTGAQVQIFQRLLLNSDLLRDKYANR